MLTDLTLGPSFKVKRGYPNLKVLIKRPVRDACLCMGELQAPPAPAAPPAPHFVFLITL